MSKKTQGDQMRAIAKLLESDLGYIYGERESGPNGDKKAFLNKARAFLTTLGKDLGFCEQKVSVNKGGIAVSGEVTLRGSWPDGSGIVLTLEQFPFFMEKAAVYRPLVDGAEQKNTVNQWVSLTLFKRGDYFSLLAQLSALYQNKGGNLYGNVA